VREFNNAVLKKILGPARQNITREWGKKKVYSGELRSL